MTPEKTEKNDGEVDKKPEKPSEWKWGDEIKPKEEDLESEVLEDDDQTYDSVAKLLEGDEESEKRRLEEYFKKQSESIILDNNSKIDANGEPIDT